MRSKKILFFYQILDFLTTINSNIATVSVIGQTTEGRDIHVVKISSGGPPKKSILIDSNIHAREWIAGATGTWIINELITNADTYAGILEEVDIYVIPMINADGYEYSRTNDRMWRKTRSVNPGSSCMGCDPNRNFRFMWGKLRLWRELEFHTLKNPNRWRVHVTGSML